MEFIYPLSTVEIESQELHLILGELFDLHIQGHKSAKHPDFGGAYGAKYCNMCRRIARLLKEIGQEDEARLAEIGMDISSEEHMQITSRLDRKFDTWLDEWITTWKAEHSEPKEG